MMKNIHFNLTTKGIAPTGLVLSYDINLLLLLQKCCSYGAEFISQIFYEDKLMYQISCELNKYE